MSLWCIGKCKTFCPSLVLAPNLHLRIANKSQLKKRYPWRGWDGRRQFHTLLHHLGTSSGPSCYQKGPADSEDKENQPHGKIIILYILYKYYFETYIHMTYDISHIRRWNVKLVVFLSFSFEPRKILEIKSETAQIHVYSVWCENHKPSKFIHFPLSFLRMGFWIVRLTIWICLNHALKQFWPKLLWVFKFL